MGGIAATRCGWRKIIIDFTQIIRIAIDNIHHPPPSGARRAPPLVLLAATQGVRSSGVSVVASSLVGAGCTSVLLADAVAVRPTVATGERHFSGCAPPAGVPAGVPLRQAAASTNFLLVAVRVLKVAVSAKLAAMSY